MLAHEALRAKITAEQRNAWARVNIRRCRSVVCLSIGIRIQRDRERIDSQSIRSAVAAAVIVRTENAAAGVGRSDVHPIYAVVANRKTKCLRPRRFSCGATRSSYCGLKNKEPSVSADWQDEIVSANSVGSTREPIR